VAEDAGSGHEAAVEKRGGENKSQPAIDAHSIALPKAVA